MATIVFCEDQANIRKLITVAMRGTGHTILLAEDGAAGLALIRERKPDLVVADLAMPNVDGLELYRVLRSEPASASIKIIFLTASTHQGLIRQAKTLPVNGLLTKPFSPHELRRTPKGSSPRRARGTIQGGLSQGRLDVSLV
jgi:CheY-like chemotaxis protein